MNRSSKKKQRVASDADPHGLASTNIVHPLAGSPIGRGATAGVVAQQSGIMPVAVTLFTVLAACHFWRLAMPVSEAVKSLVECNFECNAIASMPPPPKLNLKRGQTPYWSEAKRWARQVWVAEILGQDAVDAALAQAAAGGGSGATSGMPRSMAENARTAARSQLALAERSLAEAAGRGRASRELLPH